MNEQTHRADETAEDTRNGVSYSPDVDIVETDEAILIHADMPGVSEEGIEVKLEEDVLSLVGKIEEADEADDSAVHTEFGTGNFKRRFSISSEVVADKIEGRISDGVLELVLPKQSREQPRSIPIASG